MKNKKIIIFGVRDFAELVYEYFHHDSEYEVVAFTLNKEFIDDTHYQGLPVIAFEEIEKHYSPAEHYFFAALSYRNMNRNRYNKYIEFKSKGYKPASYISSRCFKWHNTEIGEHCFIFEDNTLQPFVQIKNNVILWSGNHIGHGSIIEDNVFVTSHVVVSGCCIIGANSFVGVNSTLANDTKIGRFCWVNHAAVLSGTISENSMVKSIRSEIIPLDEARLGQKLSEISKGRNYND